MSLTLCIIGCPLNDRLLVFPLLYWVVLHVKSNRARALDLAFRAAILALMYLVPFMYTIVVKTVLR
jgi:hypothetical protein